MIIWSISFPFCIVVWHCSLLFVQQCTLCTAFLTVQCQINVVVFFSIESNECAFYVSCWPAVSLPTYLPSFLCAYWRLSFLNLPTFFTFMHVFLLNRVKWIDEREENDYNETNIWIRSHTQPRKQSVSV